MRLPVSDYLEIQDALSVVSTRVLSGEPEFWDKSGQPQTPAVVRGCLVLHRDLQPRFESHFGRHFIVATHPTGGFLQTLPRHAPAPNRGPGKLRGAFAALVENVSCLLILSLQTVLRLSDRSPMVFENGLDATPVFCLLRRRPRSPTLLRLSWPISSPQPWLSISQPGSCLQSWSQVQVRRPIRTRSALALAAGPVPICR